MRIQIRRYAPRRDFEGMFRVTREIVSLAPYREARKELAEYPRKTTAAFVATGPDGKIVGFCAASYPYWNRVAIIDYLVVAPAHRRQGAGARLVRRVERAAVALGARRICVQTISWNRDGIRFYRRLGYRERARLPGYFDDRHTMVWLDRPLTKPRR